MISAAEEKVLRTEERMEVLMEYPGGGRDGVLSPGSAGFMYERQGQDHQNARVDLVTGSLRSGE